jgi:hypothetical protein
MTAMSDVLENAVLDHVLRNVPLSTAGISTGTVFAALFVTPTTDTGGGIEVVGGSYTRTSVASFTVPASGSSNNSSTVTFPSASANWGVVTHFALFDAATGGNMLFHGPLTTPKVVNAGDSFVFPVGNITVSMD